MSERYGLRKTMSVAEFQARILDQGVPHEHYAFRCPVCNTVQSATDLIKAGAGKTFDDVEKYLAFTCVGSFTGAGPHVKGEPAGRGCDWTLGGLFQFHKLEVETPDGKRNPRFEVASPEEALMHMNRKGGAA